MAQKEGRCPIPWRKGGIPNALHRLNVGCAPHQERRKHRWLKTGLKRQILQASILRIRPNILNLWTFRILDTQNIGFLNYSA